MERTYHYFEVPPTHPHLILQAHPDPMDINDFSKIIPVFDLCELLLRKVVGPLFARSKCAMSPNFNFFPLNHGISQHIGITGCASSFSIDPWPQTSCPDTLRGINGDNWSLWVKTKSCQEVGKYRPDCDHRPLCGCATAPWS